MTNNKTKVLSFGICALLLFCHLCFGICHLSLAQEETVKEPVIVNGDKVEFFSAEKKVVAEGNVIITQKDTKLVCDKVTVYSQTQDAIAEGNVHFYYDNGILEAEKFIYNFH